MYSTLEIIDIKLREGQLLTFPAHIMHRSPVNKSKERKTVISFNTNILILVLIAF